MINQDKSGTFKVLIVFAICQIQIFRKIDIVAVYRMTQFKLMLLVTLHTQHVCIHKASIFAPSTRSHPKPYCLRVFETCPLPETAPGIKFTTWSDLGNHQLIFISLKIISTATTADPSHQRDNTKTI